MELGIKKKFINTLSLLSCALGFINLLGLNIAIIIKRNVFPNNYSYVLIVGIIMGLLALIYKRDIQTLLGIFMSALTGVAIIIILLFSYAINPVP